MEFGSRRTIYRAGILLVIIFCTGVIGYRLIGGPEHGWLGAIYMTVITLTTVGYGEIIAVSPDPWAQVFTVILLLTGVSTFVLFFSHITAFIVEGTLDRVLWKRKMKKAIEQLCGHYIVCGFGNTGEHIVHELLATERLCVVIDSDEEALRRLYERAERPYPAVVGDATDDDTLKRAGVERAQGLIACTPTDKDNLIIVMSARLLNPALRIVSRCVDQRVEEKIRKAGADAVVSPDFIGGMRIVSEMVRPTVVSFLDIMLRDRDRRLRVESVQLAPHSALIGLSIDQIRRRLPADVLLLALALGKEHWEYNPPGDRCVEAGMELIVMTSPEGRHSVEAAARALEV